MANAPEEYDVLGGRNISYSGVFDPREIFDMIERYFREREYDREDKVHEAKDFETGKQMEIKLDMIREMGKNEKFIAKVVVNMVNLNPVEVIVHGKKRSMMKGTIKIIFKGVFKTDVEGKWSDGWMRVMRYAADNFAFKHIRDDQIASGITDVEFIHKQFLEYFGVGTFSKP